MLTISFDKEKWQDNYDKYYRTNIIFVSIFINFLAHIFLKNRKKLRNQMSTDSK
jgi:hypothetical protein